MSARLVISLLLILPFLQGEVFQGPVKDGKANDGCPRHFRLCNDECLERTTNHTTPCDRGPWGKCLSANFPFYCNVSNTCIRKDELCGDDCFEGNAGSFWYDHTIYDDDGDRDRKVNLWELEKGVYDETDYKEFRNIPKWLQRYNCNGKCIIYSETCNGGCDHPEEIKTGGVTINIKRDANLLKKCGTTCRRDMRSFHDCGDECLYQGLPCNGTCPDSTEYATGPQWLCGNECRPKDQQSWGFQRWRVCPDGTCRDNSVNCDGPLPGTCPPGNLLCRYHSWIRGTDFSCRSSSDYYICNETRENNVWGQKHPDEWCFLKSEPCEGKCLPGYINCLDRGEPTCKNATEYIKCGNNCKSSSYYHNCNGTCIETRKKCNGACAEGFKKCGVRCIKNDDPYSVECDGTCQPASKLCNGKCTKAGWFSVRNECEPDNMKKYYHECNGIFVKFKTPCNGTCVSQYKYDTTELCGGNCLSRFQMRDCDGECIDKMKEHCNGVCDTRGKVPCGKFCKYKYEIKSGRRTCGDECISEQEMCDGVCLEGRVVCGQKCLSENQMKWNRECGDTCLAKNVPCEGECTEEFPFKCMGNFGGSAFYGEICVQSEDIGDGTKHCEDGSDETTGCFKLWKCNGKFQCINKPCPHHDEDQDTEKTICPSHVNKTIKRFGDIGRYAMYYCAAEDECKLEGIPCNGVCMVDINVDRHRPLEPHKQFACEDGRKCIEKFRVCDGKKDCDDGSDEHCRCNGEINCQERLRVKGITVYDIDFRCESGDQYVKMQDYCNGKEDCNDGSDERCEKCPGIIKCRNGELVCANVPCNNTGMNGGSPDYNKLAGLDDLTCEAEGWDLCQTGPGEAKCVKKAIEGNPWSKGRDGDVCNGKCLAGVLCGDKCKPKLITIFDTSWNTACNGLCEHIKSSEPMVQCDGYCLTEEQLVKSRWYSNVKQHQTLVCNGECRVNFGEVQREEASRQTCNGTCLYGKGHSQWFPCATGDQCFSEQEWCNGLRDCQDGTDEAGCSHCPKIEFCIHRNHPLVNQTSSNGPRFPDYVCNNEPCGKCSQAGTFPCGNRCIPKDQICSLSGLCSSPTQFKCDKCIEAPNVCDGKEDCEDGTDEDNCVNYKGSWICNGMIQTKMKPCI